MSISPTIQPKRSPSTSLSVVAHFIDPLLTLQLEYKLFVLSCLAEHQRRKAHIQTIIDDLDADAEVDAECCELIEQICNESQLHQFAILNLIAVDLVIDQLASPVP